MIHIPSFICVPLFSPLEPEFTVDDATAVTVSFEADHPRVSTFVVTFIYFN